MIERLFGGLRQERGTHLAAIELLVAAGAAALIGIVRMLDLDDIGAEHGELIGGERPGEDVGHVDYADSLERSHRRGLLHVSFSGPTILPCQWRLSPVTSMAGP